MKLSRIVLLLAALGVSSLAIARSVETAPSCCHPGAACCADGSCPLCHHAS